MFLEIGLVYRPLLLKVLGVLALIAADAGRSAKPCCDTIRKAEGESIRSPANSSVYRLANRAGTFRSEALGNLINGRVLVLRGELQKAIVYLDLLTANVERGHYSMLHVTPLLVLPEGSAAGDGEP